ELREFDDSANSYSGAVGSLAGPGQFSLDDSSTVIDTSDLEGDYVITARNTTAGNRQAVITNSNGVVTNTTRSPTDANSYAGVEITLQELDASFADDSVELNDGTDVEFESLRNNNNYDVEISSDELTDDEIETLFGDTVIPGTGTTFTADDSVVEEGETYNFTFDVTDTSASDTASITIGQEVDFDANFDESVYTETRGDVATISLTTEGGSSPVTVDIGSEDSGYNATLVVEPNDDGEAEITINTWMLGNDSTSDAYTATTGDIDHDNSTESTLPRVIESGLYDMSVSSDGNELDVAALDLTERSTGDMTLHVVPDNQVGRLSDVESYDTRLGTSITEGDEVATADGVVHAVEIDGIEGYLAANDVSSLAEVANSNEFDLTVEQTNPGQNRDPKELNLAASGSTDLTYDAENDTLYVTFASDTVMFDQEGDQVNAEIGDEFESELTVTSNYTSEFTRGEGDAETANGTFSVVDREATFDTQNGMVRVPPTEDAEISGTTTVAPGTEMTVRARATGDSPFLNTAPATVDANGSFAGTFDFSDVNEGQNFTATITSQGFEDNAETPGQVGELETAGVTISDQEYTGEASEIVVDSAFLPEGGFVTIHDGSLLDGATFDSVRGTSDYLSEGENTDVTVTLDTPYTEDGTAIAMPHMDTNDNQEYDFVSSEGAEDSPYADANGTAITDSASVTISEETATETEAPDTETEAPDTETEAPETDTETPAQDQPGFGAVIALIALLGAALLAARRNAF
ncbi:DUF7282 domain-containing protein, partial [Natronomonas sp.]|uniref:DUF7282 domain-containing protein n=1 Tax=Natronomonas sp. TaxID=2184060 RepID=UPI002FC2F8D5